MPRISGGGRAPRQQDKPTQRALNALNRFLNGGSFANGLEIGTGNVVGIADNGVTDARLRDGSACSVIGRSANSVGDPADIAAATNDRVLARIANALSWVQLTIGMVPDALITKAKIENSGACSVVGRSANSTGVVADISATTNDRLLARTSNALSWVQLTIGMIPDGLITKAKIENVTASRFLGRGSASGAGAPVELAFDSTIVISGTTAGVVNAGTSQRGAVLMAAASSDASSTVSLTGVTMPADTPADADALRDDLVANALANLETRTSELKTYAEAIAANLNDLKAKVRTSGVLTP